MRPDSGDGSYLWDMQNYAERILRLAEPSTFDQFLADELLRTTIERYLEIVGEAATHVSPEFRQQNSQVPWQKVVAFRNVLAHGYRRVVPEVVWQIATEDIPPLLTMLIRLMPPPTAEEDSR